MTLRKIAALMLLLGACFVLASCDPVLHLNPKYSYTSFGLELGETVPADIEEYVDLVVRCLEIIPPGITIHRLTGDVPRRLLIAPEWSYRKRTILNMINSELARRDTYQGAALAQSGTSSLAQ